MSSQAPQTKKFQKGERTITPADQKASKYYPAEDEAVAKKVRICHGGIGVGEKEMRSTV